jgi:hypothetical protein
MASGAKRGQGLSLRRNFEWRSRKIGVYVIFTRATTNWLELG